MTPTEPNARALDSLTSPVESLWVEKYRPRKLDQMALPDEHRNLLQSYLEKGEVPHLLLVGPPGGGKTTTAKILIDSLECEVLKMNASKDRGIDVIRDRIGTFAKTKAWSKWKIVFLDEADGLTPDAQNAMRAMMEDYHDQTRFILAANNGFKIIAPLQSRCVVMEFGESPLKERIQILQKILSAEGAQAEMTVMLGYAEKYSDLRRMIGAAQRSVLANKGVLKPASEQQISGSDLLSWVGAGKWDDLVKASQNPMFEHRRGLEEMFWAVDLKNTKKPAQFRYILAKAVHESMWTPDTVVHFLGTCAELMTL